MKTLIKFDQFLRIPHFFYKTIGVRAYDEPERLDAKRTFLDDLRLYSALINMNYVVISEMIFVIQAFVNGNNFLDAIMSMSYIGFVVVGECKIITIWLKKRELTCLIWDLKEIFPKNPNTQNELKVEKYLRQCSIVTIGFSTLYMVLIWTYNFFAIVQWLIYEVWMKVRTVGQTLPYFMYIPWDWHNNWTYYFIYASQDFAGYAAAAAQISSDLLFAAIATQMIMHYDHVARSIEEYNLKANKPTTNAFECYRQHKEDLKFLGTRISYHAKILNFSDIINDVFGLSLLINFMTSSFVICFVGFHMTIGDTETETRFKLFLYLFSSSVQVYIISHYGQLLIDASTNISRAVYFQNWFNADIRFKKMLVLIAQRAQKPALLKATTFVSISMDTMTDIMQMSYKFFALLRTMYSD